MGGACDPSTTPLAATPTTSANLPLSLTPGALPGTGADGGEDGTPWLTYIVIALGITILGSVVAMLFWARRGAQAAGSTLRER